MIPTAVAERRITILGATGSVGRATLDLIAEARNVAGPEACPIEAVVAGSNVEDLALIARRFRPAMAVVADASGYARLKEALAGTGVEAAAGPEAVDAAAARPADWVMAAIVGAAGLAPTLTAARRGAAIALANKEALVCAGTLLTRTVEAAGGVLLPVDSEHNAIFQVLEPHNIASVERLILTASGGPFRDWPRARMQTATPEQAVAHPNWSMGAKISVDSATLMNKGLELIEARHLFAMPPEKLDVVVHPQSVVHSLVAYEDGSVLAQLGTPDMTIPIASTLAWPARMATPAKRLDLAAVGSLTFERPDEARFPALSLAREALSAGRGATAALNAANEVAVARFLDRRIGFLDIPSVVEQALESHLKRQSNADAAETLDELLDIDRAARSAAERSAAALTG